jgi:hypothetical protein
VIIIYLFAICGYLFIQDDFLMEVQTKTFAIDNQNINLTIKNKTDLLSKLNKEDRFFRNALYVFYC